MEEEKRAGSWLGKGQQRGRSVCLCVRREVGRVSEEQWSSQGAVIQARPSCRPGPLSICTI